MSSWWGKDNARDPSEGRDGDHKNKVNSNIEGRSRHRDAKYGGYHRLGYKPHSKQRTEIVGQQ